MVKAIFLDFEGVVTKNWNILHGVLFPTLQEYVTMEELDRRYGQAKVGKMTFEEFVEGIPEEKWRAFAKHVLYREGSREALEALKREGKCDLYLASNHVPGFFEKEIGLMGCKKYFKGIFVSHEMGSAKPDREFFERMLKETGLRAKDCVFVDDAKRNLEAAKRLGFMTVWMDNENDDKRNNVPFRPDARITDLRELEGLIR